MEKPTPEQIAATCSVTPAYGRMLLAGTRTASLAIALRLYDEYGWKTGPLASLADKEIRVARKMANAS